MSTVDECIEQVIEDEIKYNIKIKYKTIYLIDVLIYFIEKIIYCTL